MELKDKIERFVAVNSGNGSGYGDGYGDGNGSGYGDGNGSGNGSGSGISAIEGNKVYNVDDIPTIITSVHGMYAKGYTLRNNVMKVPCYVARCGDYFAHGKTLKEAQADARAKYEQNRPLADRIADFMAKYPTLDTKAKHSDLYMWHNILTGSCAFGRQEWAKAHNLSRESGEMTISKFIEMTLNAYGGDVIRQLKERYV